MKQPPDAPRFFTRQPLAAGSSLTLEEGPSRHISGALRLRPGALIRLFNGEGGEFTALLSDAGRHRVSVQVEEFFAVEHESPLPVTLGLGVSRGERMDYAVQKCTELGVARIVPLMTERTEVRLKGDRQDKKQRHWEQVAISACEQCCRNRLPLIDPITALDDWLAGPLPAAKLVLHHRADTGLTGQAAPESVALLIGPEGGLSDREIASALAAGFSALRLGSRVLRTETAPVAALSILQFHWGDMQ